MNEITSNTTSAVHAAASERLLGFLRSASEHLRSGEDAQGIEDALSALLELEKLVEHDQNAQQPQIDMSQLLPAVKTLYDYIRNQDITGIGDLLEDVLCSMAGEWMKGSEGT